MDRKEVIDTSYHRCEQDEAEQHNEKPFDCPFGSDFIPSLFSFFPIQFFQAVQIVLNIEWKDDFEKRHLKER